MSTQPEILIVDDDISFCKVVDEYLGTQGYKTAAVCRGEEALELLTGKNFDIALLDLVMPGMDGYEVMEFINKNRLKTVVIVITGYGSKQSAVISLRKGVYDFLEKPFDLEELSITIENALAKKRAEDMKKQAKKRLAEAYNAMEKKIRRHTDALTQNRKELFREIEKRNRAEAAFRESETKYKLLTDNLNVGVFRNAAGPRGRFLEVNPAIIEMFGVGSREKFVELNFSDLCSDSADSLKFNERLRREGIVKNAELKLRRMDNRKFIGSVSAVSVKDMDGNVRYHDGVIEDITEKKLADETLIRNERWYRTLTQIGLSLSAEKDTKKLLERIVVEARALTNSDAGTLYLLDKKQQELVFEIVQNDSMKVKMGGSSGSTIDLPSVPLFIDGKPNHNNVSSKVALTGKTINIKDVYGSEGSEFPGPKQYDAFTGYHTKSMLVIPLRNHESEIIGVLQLLNAQDRETGEVIPFSEAYVELIASLASQAAVALTNAKLIENLNQLFYAFIRSIATAIDEKSPYTGGHINRVVQLSMMLAEKINQAETGYFKDVHFKEDEMEELRLAAWMHDVGKVTTPEYVVNKASKLETIFDRINLIETRFALIAAGLVNKHLSKKLNLIIKNHPDMHQLEEIDKILADELQELYQELEYIKSCNKESNGIAEDTLVRLNQIGKKTFAFQGREYPYLTEDEIKNLSVRHGNLTDDERKIVENHATVTLKILKQLSFPWKMRKVPDYAGGHHEKLDGSGYPQGLTAKDLPLQTRILAIVDIFEALTARDRPYRKPMKLSEVIKIISFMKEKNKIDPNLYDLLIGSGAYYEYVLKEMDPKQIDLPNPNQA